MNARNYFRSLLPLFILTLFVMACVGDSTSGSIEPDERLEIITGFTSIHLKQVRNIYIYRPENYDTTTGGYPVVYIHDGGNLFTASGAAPCWNLNRTIRSLEAADLIPPMLYVGIGNTAYRTSEYNMGIFTDLWGGAQTGTVDQYAQFIIMELMPYIQSNYRVLSGPDNTGTMGASYGGMAALYLAWNHPDIFGKAACLSNALGQLAGAGLWSDMPLFAEIRNYTGSVKPVRLWISSGDAEAGSGYDPDHNGVSAFAEWNADLTAVLCAKGWTYGSGLLCDITPGGEHNEAAWEALSAPALRFLFETDADMTVTGINARVSKSTIGTNSTAYLFIKAAYANGMQADIPAGECIISSAQSALYSIRDDGRISSGATGGTITLNISYKGQNTTTSLLIQ